MRFEAPFVLSTVNSNDLSMKQVIRERNLQSFINNYKKRTKIPEFNERRRRKSITTEFTILILTFKEFTTQTVSFHSQFLSEKNSFQTFFFSFYINFWFIKNRL